MLNRKRILFGICLLVVFAMQSCESEYSRSVKNELASGEVHEGLLFDLKMGQTKKEFYAICWDLNKEKLISQGPGNNYARYVFDPSEGSDETAKIEMLFYGIFDNEDIMRGLDMKLSFIAYAPWNEKRQAGELMSVMRDYYIREYNGNEFLKIDLDDNSKFEAWVKVDGNRQILMYQVSQKDVIAKIEDLRFLRKSK